MNHHTHDPVCPLCEDKLFTAHDYLKGWFRSLKSRYPNVHVSWAYRGQADQEEFFKEGKTRAHYPHSAHNKTDEAGKPCSLALDLFQIDEDGVARFSPLFYAKIADESEKDGALILWGGTFKNIGDRDHFQYKG
jgi:hypothetical protein